MTNAQKFSTKFIGKTQLNSNTFEFKFEKPVGFDFEPGQYLKIFLPIEKPDNRGTSRYFTISSSSAEPYLTISTKVIKSTFKKTLANLKPGENISIFGPLGYFNLNIKNKKSKIFLAAGMGITPYHSILKSLTGYKFPFKIFLFASFGKRSDLIYLDEFNKLQAMNPALKIIYTLTKEKDNFLENGRISVNMIGKYFPEWKNAEFFVVGSESAEEGLVDLLKHAGISEENIFSENFPGY